jgi:predicted CopG family antitoxin
MAVKTITIDMEAYEALASRKKPGQSFSQVIKERFGPPKNARTLRQVLREVGGISARTLDSVESQIRSRKRSRARVPAL